MSWRVLLTTPVETDLERLEEAERAALMADLFAWVDPGAPMTGRRTVGGAVLFEDDVPSGFRVTYFVEEPERYVGVVRVRKL